MSIKPMVVSSGHSNNPDFYNPFVIVKDEERIEKIKKLCAELGLRVLEGDKLCEDERERMTTLVIDIPYVEKERKNCKLLFELKGD